MKAMAYMYSIFLWSFCIISLQGAEDIYIPLFKFDSSASVQQWMFNGWSGKKQCKKTFKDANQETIPKFMRITYSDSNATLSSSAFSKILNGKVAQRPVSNFYIRYRAKNLTGRIKFQYVTKKDGKKSSFYNGLGLKRDGKWRCAKMSLGGWNKEKKKFDLSELTNLVFIFYGSGTVDISEIGMTYKLLPQNVIFTPPQNYLRAGFGDNTPVIDGKIEGGERKNAGTIKNLISRGKTPVKTEDKTITFIKATPQGIYCAAKCYKRDMSKLKAEYKKNSVRIYMDESVEFSFDPGRTTKRFRKIAVNANGYFGGISNSLDNSGIKAASKIYSDRWETEVLIPWKFLKISSKKPFTIGFNITRNCYDTGTLKRTGWTTTVWNAVAKFGVVGFGKKPVNISSKTSQTQIRKIKAGSYLLIGQNTGGTAKCRVSITDPDKNTITFNKQIKKGTYRIPIKFKTLSTGKYHIGLLVWNTAGIKSFQETSVSEIVDSSIKSLDVDNIALFPIPKIFKRKQGFIALNIDTKINVSGKGISFCGDKLISELDKFYGLKLKTSPNWQSANIVIGLSSNPNIKTLIKQLKIGNGLKRIQYDGFALVIDSEKILITANENRGLYYGVNALLELIKMSSGDVGGPKVCKVKIIDWPNSEFRFFHQMMHAFYPRNKYNVDFFDKILERFPMSFRFNGFLFEVGDYYKWESAKLGHKYSWTQKDFSQVVDFINRRYMAVMPSIQSLGHMRWWLFRSKRLKALWEAGSDDVICTGNPDSYKLLFDLYNENLKICSRNLEFKPKYFFTSLDEVRWKISPKKLCKYCKNTPKNKLFLEHIKKLNSFINKKGAKMMMCTDMLVEEHNGLNEFKCAEIVNQIPKNIIMCHWSSLDFPSINKFSKLGFNNWKFLTLYRESRIGEKDVKGYTFNVCTYHWWLSKTRCHNNAGYGLMAQALFLNNCWNSLPNDGSTVWRINTKIYGNLLMRNWSRKPLLHAGKKVYSLDLSQVANTPVTGPDGWFGEGKDFDLSKVDFNIKQLAGIPVKFTRGKGGVKCYIPDRKPSKVITLEKKAASLILLHGAHLASTKAKNYWNPKYYKDPLGGKKIVKYTVSYTGGSKSNFTINYGWNISEWRIDPLSKNEVFSKYLADSRFVWENQTPYAAQKNIGFDIAIYQYEWVNPFPKKVIQSISITVLEPYISYALLAISVRETK